MKQRLLFFVFTLAAFAAMLSSALAAPLPQPDEMEWTAFQSLQLGISFSYPSDWTIAAAEAEPTETTPYIITLYAPDDNLLKGNRIDIAYLSFERNGDKDLKTWSEMYELAAHGSPSPEAIILRQEHFTGQDGAEHEFLLKMGRHAGPFQAALLTNGRLVLSASSYTHTELATQILEKLADSVVFGTEAPKTLDDLNGTATERMSLEDVLEQNGRGGGDPCDVVCQDEDTQRRLTPTPPPPTRSLGTTR